MGRYIYLGRDSFHKPRLTDVCRICGRPARRGGVCPRCAFRILTDGTTPRRPQGDAEPKGGRHD